MTWKHLHKSAPGTGRTPAARREQYEARSAAAAKNQREEVLALLAPLERPVIQDRRRPCISGSYFLELLRDNGFPRRAQPSAPPKRSTSALMCGRLWFARAPVIRCIPTPTASARRANRGPQNDRHPHHTCVKPA